MPFPKAVPSLPASHTLGHSSNTAQSTEVSSISDSVIRWTELTFKYLYTVPPIILAAIALQESTCNPSTVGGNGEQGLMQLTVDKCSNAPGGNCQDIVRSICPPPFHRVPVPHILTDASRHTTSRPALRISTLFSMPAVATSYWRVADTTAGIKA